jgi:hypothetical protein
MVVAFMGFSKSYIHRRQFNDRVLRPYWKTTLFKGLREFHEALSYLDIQHVRVQEEGYTVSGYHCICFTSFIDVQDPVGS